MFTSKNKLTVVQLPDKRKITNTMYNGIVFWFTNCRAKELADKNKKT